MRAPLQAVLSLVAAEQPLELVDEAIDSGLLRLDERHGAAILEFAHPLTRGAVYAAIPTARRSRLNAAAAMIVHDPLAKLRHRVEAATVVDDALLRELEQFARGEMARGAWSGAVSSLLAASRLTSRPADRERFALEGSRPPCTGATELPLRRLAEQTNFGDGPRRDSVLAYLAIFDGDVAAAERLLTRAWERRDLAGRSPLDDDRPAKRVSRHVTSTRARSDRVGSAGDGLRAARSRHRAARCAVAAPG